MYTQSTRADSSPFAFRLQSLRRLLSHLRPLRTGLRCSHQRDCSRPRLAGWRRLRLESEKSRRTFSSRQQSLPTLRGESGCTVRTKEEDGRPVHNYIAGAIRRRPEQPDHRLMPVHSLTTTTTTSRIRQTRSQLRRAQPLRTNSTNSSTHCRTSHRDKTS